VTRLVLVTPAELEKPTGGNRYDRSLAMALEELGTEVDQRPLAGRWPVAAQADRDRLAVLLRASDPVLVDGLLACGAPDPVVAAVASGARVHVLVHLPLALETGLSSGAAAELEALERDALHAATGVIATSHWAAAELCGRHGLDVVAVAPPGSDPAIAATGSNPPRLLQLASVTPRKDQLGLLAALAQVRDLAWTADLVGPLDVDPEYAAQVRAAIGRRELADRVRLIGPAGGAELRAVWDAADLLLLPSYVETWGMVVSEGLARGIPAVVGRGSGAEEALGFGPGGERPGAVVRPGDPAGLALALRDLLGPGRERARRAARARSGELRQWQDTARDVLAAILPTPSVRPARPAPPARGTRPVRS
jgi:glycosyltransferase involved in cell wall biosynthesis